MPFDGGIPLMEDGPGVNQRLGGAEELLHQVQALILLRPFNCSHFMRRHTAHVFHENIWLRYEVAFSVYVDSHEDF